MQMIATFKKKSIISRSCKMRLIFFMGPVDQDLIDKFLRALTLSLYIHLREKQNKMYR